MTNKYDDWAAAYKEWYEKDWNKCHTCGSKLTGKILKEHLKEWIRVVGGTIKEQKKKKENSRADQELLEFLQWKMKTLDSEFLSYVDKSIKKNKKLLEKIGKL